MESNEWNFEPTSLAAFLIPGVIIPAILLMLAFFQPTRRQMDRWAAVCGVTLTDTNREQVRTHLTRGRRFRSLAAFPFWWIAFLPFVNAGFSSRLTTPIPAMAAYLVGALVAEITGGHARTPATAERRATLLTRTMDDYAPRWARMLPYALFAVGAVAVALARYLDGPGSVTEAAFVVALSIVFGTGAVLVGHTIVRRPQRGDEPDVLAADDALRATAISTAYAAAALSGLVAASTGMASVIPDAGWSWWLLLLVLTGQLATYGMTIGLLMVIVRQETWGYRRRHRQRAAALATVPA